MPIAALTIRWISPGIGPVATRRRRGGCGWRVARGVL